MQYCKDFDGSPNTFLAVMFARAARRYDPESEKTVSIAIAIDHKAMLGVRENYRMFANVVELDFPKNRALDDLLRACTGARGQVMLQAQPETSLWVMKQRKQTFAKLAQLPLEAKLGALRKSAGAPRWSFSLSYTNSRSFGPLDPYIEELYVLSEPGVTDLNVRSPASTIASSSPSSSAPPMTGLSTPSSRSSRPSASTMKCCAASRSACPESRRTTYKYGSGKKMPP